jgi:hypothetical protein
MQSKTLYTAAVAPLLVNTRIALGQEDCGIAAVYMPRATVNCDYVREKGGGNNFVNYVGELEDASISPFAHN